MRGDEVVLPAPTRRRPFGWCLLVGGALDAGRRRSPRTIVAWVVLGDAQRSSRQALEVTDQALESVNDSLQVAGTVVGSVRQSMTTVGQGLDAASAAVGSADATLAQVQQLAAALPASLDGAVAAVGSLTNVADGIDRALGVLSRAPLVPDYHAAFGDVVRQLGQALTPLAATTRGLSNGLAGTLADGTAVRDRLRDLNAQVAAVNQALAGAQEQLVGYQATAAQARAVAEATRHDLDRDLTLLRAVAVPFGLGLALGQLLPIWYGLSLVRVPPRRSTQLG